MFEGKSLFDILALGGFTLYVLLLASCISIAVIILKIREFIKKAVNINVFFEKLKLKLERQTIDHVIEFCRNFDRPVINVIRECLIYYKKNKDTKNMKEVVSREVSLEIKKLEQYTPIVATIGGISVYIGLFGTVLGIIRSFHDISLAGSGGISVVIGGVSESLIATAAGLSVAIPAVIAYNFFMRAIDNFNVDMEYAGSLVKELLESSENEKKKE